MSAILIVPHNTQIAYPSFIHVTCVDKTCCHQEIEFKIYGQPFALQWLIIIILSGPPFRHQSTFDVLPHWCQCYQSFKSIKMPCLFKTPQAIWRAIWAISKQACLCILWCSLTMLVLIWKWTWCFCTIWKMIYSPAGRKELIKMHGEEMPNDRWSRCRIFIW